MKKYLFPFAALFALTVSAAFACPISPQLVPLQKQFEEIIARHDGRIGVCIQDGNDLACVHGHDTFSMQSVMKLVVSIAVMDQVDQQKLKISDPVLVRQRDISLYNQPLAKMVGKNGYKTTIGDLIKRAITESDNTAADVLLRTIGGPKQVQAFLKRKQIEGIRLDRNERDLQTAILGLTWKPDFTDPAKLDAAIAAIPTAKRDAAYKAYQKDVRDTSNVRGMTTLLDQLAKRELLSSASTGFLLNIMRQTATGKDRLKAGIKNNWDLAHKTGTSSTWQGVTAATNDVGILGVPDGRTIAISVFVADSKESDAERAAVIAELSRATVEFYNKHYPKP